MNDLFNKIDAIDTSVILVFTSVICIVLAWKYLKQRKEKVIMKPGEVFESINRKFYVAKECKGNEDPCAKCDLHNTQDCHEAPDCEPLEFSLYYTEVHHT